MIISTLLNLLFKMIDYIIGLISNSGIHIDLSGFQNALLYLKGFSSVFFYLCGASWFFVLCSVLALDVLLSLTWDNIKVLVLRFIK